MPTFIHPTALVGEEASIGDDCYIGPYCVVSGTVRLGEKVRLDSHVVVDGKTSIGDETHVFPFVSIGLPPQAVEPDADRPAGRALKPALTRA